MDGGEWIDRLSTQMSYCININSGSKEEHWYDVRNQHSYRKSQIVCSTHIRTKNSQLCFPKPNKLLTSRLHLTPSKPAWPSPQRWR